MKNPLLTKLKGISAKNVETVMFGEDDLFEPKWVSPTDVLMLNLVLTGKFDGGVSPGLTFFAGPSRSFKTYLGLLCVKAFLDKFEDGVIIYYDFEGSPLTYWQKVGIDIDRVILVKANNIEDTKFDLHKKLESIEKTDNVMIFMDSYGAIPSKKEIDDAHDENAVADMSRAKAGKSFWRVILPSLNNKRIPMVVINHVIASMDKYKPDEMGGGQGGIYSANSIIYVSKRAIKEDAADKKKNGGKFSENATNTGRVGHIFDLKLGKGRLTKEDLKLPVVMMYGQNRPDRYTGLYELAELTGDIFSPVKGWRAVRLFDHETGEFFPDDQCPKYREADMTGEEFWEEVMFKKTNFIQNAQSYVLL